MRIKSQKQLYFKQSGQENNKNEKIKKMIETLMSLPEYDEILERICKDISSGNKSSGRKGMTAEQILICSIVRDVNKVSYRELEYLTSDSCMLRELLNLGFFHKGFDYKTLQKNIKGIREDTLDFIQEQIKKYAKRNKIEEGNRIRTDGTVVATNIHAPADWRQLHDSIRVLSRIMTYCYEDEGVDIGFQNHFKSSKSKLFKINKAKIEKTKCAKTFTKYLELAQTVYDIAYRRIVKKESVPAKEKIVSIFEEHTDIIVKGLRDVQFGHKSTITAGASGLVLDVQIHKGNPCDSQIVPSVLERHKKFYLKSPKQMAFDGCYYSEDNVNALKKENIEFTFSKGKNANSTSDKKVIKKLRCFRAGIEAIISKLKRMFGLSLIKDRTLTGFTKAVKRSVIAYNLFTLANIAIKKS